MLNEHNRTGIYGEIALWIAAGKEKLGKEVEGKVIGIKSKCHIRGRNRFPTEFITGLEVGELFVLVSKVLIKKA